MAWLISALGAALALAGAISLGNGISYIRLDWGQTETVAGTVALSAGIVTLAIGAVLFTLRKLSRPTAPRPAGVGMEALSWSEEDAPVRPVLSRVRAKLSTVGIPKAERAGAGLFAAGGAGPAAGGGVPPARELDGSFTGSASAEPAPPRPSSAPVAAAVEPDLPAPVTIDAPTVVGRYEANGASYVLFSDGTIEVETDSGTHRFASMSELKDHIERHDAG